MNCSGVRAGYGRIEVLHGIDLTVGEGEIITIIGANGAGKSTLLKAISGVVRISAGSIAFERERIDSLGVESIVSRRLVQIPEGRQLFGPLTVEENLELGAYSRRRGGSPLSERLGGCSRCSRGWRSVWTSRRAPCLAESSRCWPWLGL